MAAIPLFRRYRALQYTGANSAEVMTFMGDLVALSGQPQTAHLVSSSGSQVTFEVRMTDYPTDSYTVATNNWIIAQAGSLVETDVTTARLGSFWKTAADVMAELTTARAFTNGASRSIVTGTGATGFQVSATRDSQVNYSVALSTTATIGGASTATVVLEVCPTNSATPANWVEVARVSNSQTITLAVALQSVQGVTAELSGVVPAGYFAKLRSTVTGTGLATYTSGQEVLL